MTNLLQISLNFSSFNKVHDGVGKRRSFSELKVLRPINCYSLPRRRIKSFHQNGFKLRDCDQRWSSLVVRRTGDEILVKGEWEYRKRRVVLVKGLGLNGGGGRDNRTNARILGNLALAIGLTYLSVTGQLGWILDAIGWILDAIVSLWGEDSVVKEFTNWYLVGSLGKLLAVLLPIVGLGVFIWWAGRDMVQGNCPNCGNTFQIFKSSLIEDLQLCPFCSQPFSVENDEFVQENVKFSNQAKTFGQAFSDFSPLSKKAKEPSVAVVDIEAEIRDVD